MGFGVMGSVIGLLVNAALFSRISTPLHDVDPGAETKQLEWAYRIGSISAMRDECQLPTNVNQYNRIT